MSGRRCVRVVRENRAEKRMVVDLREHWLMVYPETDVSGMSPGPVKQLLDNLVQGQVGQILQRLSGGMAACQVFLDRGPFPRCQGAAIEGLQKTDAWMGRFLHGRSCAPIRGTPPIM
jgi:hypothetical protein